MWLSHVKDRRRILNDTNVKMWLSRQVQKDKDIKDHRRVQKDKYVKDYRQVQKDNDVKDRRRVQKDKYVKDHRQVQKDNDVKDRRRAQKDKYTSRTVIESRRTSTCQGSPSSPEGQRHRGSPSSPEGQVRQGLPSIPEGQVHVKDRLWVQKDKYMSRIAVESRRTSTRQGSP